MERYNQNNFSLLILLFLLGCTAQQKHPKAILQLQWLEKANPVNDAKEAISNGDFRLRGVYGFTMILPGVGDDRFKYEKTPGINPIEGTSDGLINDEHARLNDLALKYAEQYNQVILKQLTDGTL